MRYMLVVRYIARPEAPAQKKAVFASNPWALRDRAGVKELAYHHFAERRLPLHQITSSFRHSLPLRDGIFLALAAEFVLAL